MKILENFSMKDLTTFKIGGNARYYAEVKSKDELNEAIEFAKSNKLPIFILGGGSDILVNDTGFAGLVISYKDSSINFEENQNNNKVMVTAGAGMEWDKLVEICVERNMQGVECLSGIPGTVGASPVQNIGAYGQELKDSFVSLNAYDSTENKFVVFDYEACKFEYRDSFFKMKNNWQKYLITDITLELTKGGNPILEYDSLKNYFVEKNTINPSLNEVRKAVLDIRKTKFEDPKLVGNAGSFFKNPIINSTIRNDLLLTYPELPSFDLGNGKFKCFAGWFLEKAGWKGKTQGNAKVSSMHALILLNANGNATAKEVKTLADKIIGDIKIKFNITLEPEVQFIGF